MTVMSQIPAMQPNPDGPDWVREVPDTVVRVPDLDKEVGDGTSTERRQTKPRPVYEVSKRIFDIAFVVALSPLWLPIYAFIALMILVTDGRPIHFRDQRVPE